MHFQQKQKCLLWNGGPWRLLSLLITKRFVRKELGLNKTWNIPPIFCKFRRSTYSTTLYAHVVFYKFSNPHANNLGQVFCALCFLPFCFNSRLCTSHLSLHSCYYTCRSQGTLFCMYNICIMHCSWNSSQRSRRNTPMYKLNYKCFVPKTLVCEGNERLEYLLLLLPHQTLGTKDWP
jgi:hypothetical protein